MYIAKTLPSKFEAIPNFIDEALGLLSKEVNPSEDDVFIIKLALEEAITNAIKHGNKLNPDLTVDITMTCTANVLTICIKNKGQGFDVNKIPDPTKEEGLKRTSGRGVFLVKKLMDEVVFSDEGREIKMVKRLRG